MAGGDRRRFIENHYKWEDGGMGRWMEATAAMVEVVVSIKGEIVIC